jgi:hypothetical protein
MGCRRGVDEVGLGQERLLTPPRLGECVLGMEERVHRVQGPRQHIQTESLGPQDIGSSAWGWQEAEMGLLRYL